MTTGATGQLGLALPVQGELSGTWGDTVNNGITQYTNIAIAGTLTLTGDGAVTLANTTGDASASNITSTLTGAGTVTAQFAIVRVTGTLTVAKVVTAPSYSKTYTVVNAATGGIVTFKAAGQTGVSVAVGESAFVYFNGTDYVKLVGTATAGAAGGSNTQVQFNSSGVLAGDADLTFDGTTLSTAGLTASGTVTLSGGTANGVTYLNGSKVLTSGSALTFDGTNLGVNGRFVIDGIVASAPANGGMFRLSNESNYFTGKTTGSGGAVLSNGDGTATIQLYKNSPTSYMVFESGNGTEAMRLTSTSLYTASGINVGIGLSNPTIGLTVEKNNGAGYIAAFRSGTGNPYITLQTTGGITQIQGVNSAFTDVNNIAMQISGGNVGIGTSSPSAGAKLTVAGGIFATSNITAATTAASAIDYLSGAMRLIAYGPSTSNFGIQTFSRSDGTTTTESMRIDSAGNLGLGVTPNAGTSGKVFQITDAGHFMASGSTVYIDANAYFDSGWKYITSAAASNYYQSSGAHIWQTAASGTAGNAISFTQAMTLDASGNLGVGTTSPSGGRLHVVGAIDTSVILGDSTVGDYAFIKALSYPAAADGYTIFDLQAFSSLVSSNVNVGNYGFSKEGSGTDNKAYYALSTHNGTSLGERLRITSAGNVGIGTNSPNKLLSLSTSDTSNSVTGAAGLQIVNTNASAGGRMTSITFGGRATTNYPFAAIAGVLTSDIAQEQSGDLAFYTKPTTTAVNPTERMRILADGNVGIGLTNPSYKLQVKDGAVGVTSADGTVTSTLNYNSIGTVTNSAFNIFTNSTDRMSITSAGYVGIATLSPATYGAFAVRKAVTTADTTNCSASFSDAANSTFDIGHPSANLVRLNAQGSAIAFNAGSSERMRLDTSGNLLVGTTVNSSNIKLRVKAGNGDELEMDNDGSQFTTFYLSNNGTIKVSSYWDNTNARYQIVAVSGGVYLASGGTSWTAVSDERKKDIIEPITNATSKVNQLRAVIGKYKTDAEGTRRSFLIAQDVQAVLPEAVDATNADELGLSYSEIIPLLVAAIKEQNTTIESLKARLDAANL